MENETKQNKTKQKKQKKRIGQVNARKKVIL